MKLRITSPVSMLMGAQQLAALLKGRDHLPIPPRGQKYITRFAPSPTGYLHIGHAYAALFAREAAHATGGQFLLRIEDLDPHRCRAEFEDAIYKDLNWMELYWDGNPWRQSDRMSIYEAALSELDKLGVIYPCFCSRKQIRAQIEEAGRAPHGVHDDMIYPGICRNLDLDERDDRIDRGESYALRLNVAKALSITGELSWYDLRGGVIKAKPELLGDVVIARKDIPTSYHLAVTVDDYMQGIKPCHTRRGSVRGHPHPLPDPGTARPQTTAILSPQSACRQIRCAPVQTQPRGHPAPPARQP